jgi:hypothetical protein
LVAITFDNKEKVSKLLLKRKFDFTYCKLKNSLKNWALKVTLLIYFLDENGIIKRNYGNVPVIEKMKRRETMSGRKEFIAILRKVYRKNKVILTAILKLEFSGITFP